MVPNSNWSYLPRKKFHSDRRKLGFSSSSPGVPPPPHFDVFSTRGGSWCSGKLRSWPRIFLGQTNIHMTSYHFSKVNLFTFQQCRRIVILRETLVSCVVLLTGLTPRIWTTIHNHMKLVWGLIRTRFRPNIFWLLLLFAVGTFGEIALWRKNWAKL